VIKVLTQSHLEDVVNLFNEYTVKEDLNNIVMAKRSLDDVEDILINGHMFGKFVKGKLIGITSVMRYYPEEGLKKTHLSNKIRKEVFYKRENISKENTAVILGDLILKEFRGKGYFSELHSARMDKAKSLGFTNFVAYKTVDKIEGVNDFLKAGWLIGALIKTGENKYELLLHLRKSSQGCST